MNDLRKWKAIALLATGLAVGMAISTTPATAHVGGTVAHLVTHLKQTFFTKAQSDARYLRKNATAANADKLDGLDSSDIRVGGHGASASFFDIAGCGSARMLSYPIELTRPARIYANGVVARTARSDAGHDPSIQVRLFDASAAIVATAGSASQIDSGGVLSVGGMMLSGSTPYVAQPGTYTIEVLGDTFGPCAGSVQYQDIRLSHMELPSG